MPKRLKFVSCAIHAILLHLIILHILLPHRPLWLGHSLVPQLHPHPSHQCHSREHLHISHLRRKQPFKSWQISSLLHQRFHRWRTLGQFTRGGKKLILYSVLYHRGQAFPPPHSCSNHCYHLGHYERPQLKYIYKCIHSVHTYGLVSAWSCI